MVWCCNLASRSRFRLCCCAVSCADREAGGVKACETCCCWLALPEKLEVRVPGDLVKVEGDDYNGSINEIDNSTEECKKRTVVNCLCILRPLRDVELPTGSFSSCQWGSLLFGKLSSSISGMAICSGPLNVSWSRTWGLRS